MYHRERLTNDKNTLSFYKGKMHDKKKVGTEKKEITTSKREFLL